jgi:hypothetical protein
MSEQLEELRPRNEVRICRPAFQDMQHLVLPRLTGRAQLRRHLMKLRFWRRGDRQVLDLECFEIGDEGLNAVRITDGFGLSEGFNAVFCEIANSASSLTTLCVLSIMRTDEPFSAAAIEILRGRATIAGERLSSLGI